MADRTVKVSLLAVTANYVQGMKQAKEATEQTTTATQKLAEQREAMERVGTAFLTVGGLIAAGLGLAIKEAADFDAQMSQIKTLSHGTAGEMDQLRNAALTAGQAIGFSANEVADAETELVKAGVSVKDILGGGLKGALDLAAAGQLSVADATSIAASAMVQFGLKGKDVPHIADLLAAGADKALGSVQDLGNALKFVGPVANNLGVSIEQVTGTLALFAQNGILGEQAGTSLRGVLLSLTSPSKQAADVMEKYGISLYNAQGKFVGVDGAAEQLKKRLGPLDDATRNLALGQIFGNEQITAATVLYKGGASAVDKWTNSVNENGFASEQAAGKMDNLNGDLRKLQAAFQSALIDTGETSQSSLRGVVQAITGLVQAFSSLGPGAQSAVFIVGALAAGVLLLGGGFLVAVPKVAAFKASLDTLQLSGKGAARALGTITAGLTIAGAVFALYANQQAKIATNAAALTDTLNSQTGALTKNSRAYVIQQLNNDNVFKAAKQAGVGQKELTDAILKGGDALDKVNKKFGETNSLGHVFDGQALGSVKAQASIKSLSESLDRSKQAFKDSKAAGDESAASSEKTADAIDSVGEASDGAATSVGDLADKLKGLTNTQLDVNSTQRDFEAAIDDATQSLKDNGAALNQQKNGFDVSTDAGRKNSAAIDDIAQSALSYSAAIYQQTGNQDQATAALESGRQSLIAALGQYGITGQAAEDYADKIIGTPTQWATTFNNNAASAGAPVDSLNTKIRNIPQAYTSLLQVNVQGAVDVDATTNAVNRLKSAIQQAAAVGAATPIVAHAGGPNQAFATGGAVYGPGSARSDSIPARLSNGEHVLTASDVRKLGGQSAVYALRAAAQAGGFRVPGYADGGAVQYAKEPTYVYPSRTAGSGGGNINNYNISAPVDPVAVAIAVERRQNLLGA